MKKLGELVATGSDVLISSGNTEEKSPEKNITDLALGTARGADCCQLHFFGVGHMVAVNGQIYRQGISVHIRAITVVS